MPDKGLARPGHRPDNQPQWISDIPGGTMGRPGTHQRFLLKGRAMGRQRQAMKPSRIGPSIILLAVLLATGPGKAASPVDLERGFVHPPDSAKPQTWWHWMNGNITQEGITADLEAMQRIGLGGAQIFNVSESIPEGPVQFMSPQWRDLVKHAVQ